MERCAHVIPSDIIPVKHSMALSRPSQFRSTSRVVVFCFWQYQWPVFDRWVILEKLDLKLLSYCCIFIRSGLSSSWCLLYELCTLSAAPKQMDGTSLTIKSAWQLYIERFRPCNEVSLTSLHGNREGRWLRNLLLTPRQESNLKEFNLQFIATIYKK